MLTKGNYKFPNIDKNNKNYSSKNISNNIFNNEINEKQNYKKSLTKNSDKEVTNINKKK